MTRKNPRVSKKRKESFAAAPSCLFFFLRVDPLAWENDA